LKKAVARKNATAPAVETSGAMPAVRFSKVVQSAGKPNVHVLWMDPAKDTELQKAITANRVLTVRQRPDGAKADYGVVGFEKGASGQIFVFPRSLKQFANQRVVGVKYDLLEWPEVSKSQQAPKPRNLKRPAKRKPQDPKATSPPTEAAAEESTVPRLLKFPVPVAEESAGPNPEMEEIKGQIRQAMEALEEGKQVAAFNLLKRIMDR
jgi:hypothetical protein